METAARHLDLVVALPRFAVVDIETSGLSLRRHRILQVAVVIVDDGVVVDEWSSLVKLRWPWQRVGPRRVHGIGRRQLRAAPGRRVGAAPARRATRRRRVHSPQRRRSTGRSSRRAARRAGVDPPRGRAAVHAPAVAPLDPDRSVVAPARRPVRPLRDLQRPSARRARTTPAPPPPCCRTCSERTPSACDPTSSRSTTATNGGSGPARRSPPAATSCAPLVRLHQLGRRVRAAASCVTSHCSLATGSRTVDQPSPSGAPTSSTGKRSTTQRRLRCDPDHCPPDRGVGEPCARRRQLGLRGWRMVPVGSPDWMRSIRNVRTSPERSSSALTYHSPRSANTWRGHDLALAHLVAPGAGVGDRQLQVMMGGVGELIGERRPVEIDAHTRRVVLAERRRQLGQPARQRTFGVGAGQLHRRPPGRQQLEGLDGVEPQRPREQARHARRRSGPRR